MSLTLLSQTHRMATVTVHGIRHRKLGGGYKVRSVVQEIQKPSGRLHNHGRFTRYCNPPIGGGQDEKCKRFEGGTWARRYNRRGVDEGARDNGIFWDVAPSEEVFEQMFRVSKNQIIWGGNYFNLPPTRCFVVWDKLTISAEFSMAMCEYAWTSFKGKNAKRWEGAPQGTKADPRFHPTQKPVGLYKFLLSQFANKGDRILDPFLGSGSSRIAAWEMGFDFVGCEIDTGYFTMQEQRFSDYTSQGNLFLQDTPQTHEDCQGAFDF